MKKFLKILVSVGITLLLIISIYYLSFFSNFYNNLNYLGIGKIVLQDIVVLAISLFVLFLTPILLFRIRSSLSLRLFSKTIELTEKHKNLLLVFDILATIAVLIHTLLNFREIYLFLTITNWNKFNLVDYPFVLEFLKFLIEYLLLVILFTLIPVLYFSHKSYLIRFIGLKIIPHKVPISIFITLTFFLLFLSISIFLYTFILSLEIYPAYSLILTIGIITSFTILIYSVGFFVCLLKNSTLHWYENIGPLILVTFFTIATIFVRSLPDISLLKLDLIEKIHASQVSSKFVIKINKGYISDVIDRIDIHKLERLREISIKEHHFENPDTTIRVIRKPKILERIYLATSSGVLDRYLKGNIYITNHINIEKTLKRLFPTTFLFSFKISNTNYIEISFPYKFDEEIFFYKRYLITWSSEKDMKILNQQEAMTSLPKNILTGKEYYLIYNKLKLAFPLYSLFSINSPNFGGYYIISTIGESITISNGVYTSYKVSDYKEGELFILLDGVPLFISNITFENKKVGVKVRYFDIEGRGGEISESISNLIGNAVYYYKVVELTNKIERLRKHLEEHKEEIPPDVFEKLKQFISN